MLLPVLPAVAILCASRAQLRPSTSCFWPCLMTVSDIARFGCICGAGATAGAIAGGCELLYNKGVCSRSSGGNLNLAAAAAKPSLTFHSCSTRALCSLESLAAGFATNLVQCVGGNATRSSNITRHGRAHPKHPGPPCIPLLLQQLLYRCKIFQDRTVIKGCGEKEALLPMQVYCCSCCCGCCCGLGRP